MSGRCARSVSLLLLLRFFLSLRRSCASSPAPRPQRPDPDPCAVSSPLDLRRLVSCRSPSCRSPSWSRRLLSSRSPLSCRSPPCRVDLHRGVSCGVVSCPSLLPPSSLPICLSIGLSQYLNALYCKGIGVSDESIFGFSVQTFTTPSLVRLLADASAESPSALLPSPRPDHGEPSLIISLKGEGGVLS